MRPNRPTSWSIGRSPEPKNLRYFDAFMDADDEAYKRRDARCWWDFGPKKSTGQIKELLLLNAKIHALKILES